MIDVALSILALIAAGLSLELFAVTSPFAADRASKGPVQTFFEVEEVQVGNPS